MPGQSLYPSARRENLVVEQLQDEVLVYDLEREQAGCLNATAALVWKYADGATPVPEIANKMAAELGAPVDARLVWYAVDQLGKKNLLQERMAIPAEYQRMTRRDFLVKAGVVGAAVAIPVIISMTAPTPAMAATCSTCSNNSQCTPCGKLCNTTLGVCQ